jgi:hypothetical protein
MFAHDEIFLMAMTYGRRWRRGKCFSTAPSRENVFISGDDLSQTKMFSPLNPAITLSLLSSAELHQRLIEAEARQLLVERPQHG